MPYYEFQRGNNANAAAKSFKSIYGDGVVCERTCRRWFSHFRKGDFSLKDEQREGRPRGLGSEVMKAAVEASPTTTVRKLSGCFNDK